MVSIPNAILTGVAPLVKVVEGLGGGFVEVAEGEGIYVSAPAAGLALDSAGELESSLPLGEDVAVFGSGEGAGSAAL